MGYAVSWPTPCPPPILEYELEGRADISLALLCPLPVTVLGMWQLFNTCLWNGQVSE